MCKMPKYVQLKGFLKTENNHLNNKIGENIKVKKKMGSYFKNEKQRWQN